MSEELEALARIVGCSTIESHRPKWQEDYKLIETALKALEIIKNKKVNVGDFVRCKTIEDYNDYLCYGEKEKLTPEEYDLLKEVLL